MDQDADMRVTDEAWVALAQCDQHDASGDANPLCGSWAAEGECVRNPQFMWTVY